MSTTNTQSVPLLEVQSVSKYFGSVVALKDISMKVYAGEVMLPARRQRRGQIHTD